MSTLEQSSDGQIIPEKTGIFSNYIVRDLTIWCVFIFFLPIVLITIYYIAKESSVKSKFTENNLDLVRIRDQINKLSQSFDARKGLEEYINEPMRRIFLQAYPNSVCNDGSPASYYIRESNSNSDVWIILLEGGYFCYDKNTCKQRSINSFNLTSSHENKPFKFGKGIMSSDFSENKYWSDANVV